MMFIFSVLGHKKIYNKSLQYISFIPDTVQRKQSKT